MPRSRPRSTAPRRTGSTRWRLLMVTREGALAPGRRAEVAAALDRYRATLDGAPADAGRGPVERARHLGPKGGRFT